jgi:hypothetical protein
LHQIVKFEKTTKTKNLKNWDVLFELPDDDIIESGHLLEGAGGERISDRISEGVEIGRSPCGHLESLAEADQPHLSVVAEGGWGRGGGGGAAGGARPQTHLVSGERGHLVMLPDLLVDRIELAALDGEHDVGTLLAAERHVLGVARVQRPLERQHGEAVRDASGDVGHVLLRVQLRRLVAADPRVHDEGASGAVHPPEDGVRLTHALVLRERDARPQVGVLGADGEVRVVALHRPLGLVLAVVLLAGAREAPVTAAALVQLAAGRRRCRLAGRR